MNFFSLPLESLKELFDNFNRKNLFKVVSIFLLIGIALILAELITGFAFYRNMEKRIALIKELNTLSESNIDQNPELYPLYLDTINELEEYNPPSLQGTFTTLKADHKPSLVETFFKYLLSGWMLLFYLPIGISQLLRADTKRARDNFLASMFGSLFCLVAYMINTPFPLFNIIFPVLIQVLIFAIIFSIPTKKPPIQPILAGATD